MKQKHTKGPWISKTITDVDTNYLLIAVGTPPKKSPDNFDRIVCLDIRGTGSYNKQVREVAEANAALIAAAPELLEALEKITKNWGALKIDPLSYTGNIIANIIAIAEAAIAIAEPASSGKE